MPAKRRRLPTCVRPVKNREGRVLGYRAVVSVEGVRRFGPTRSAAREASRDVEILRGQRLPEEILSLQDGFDAVVHELEAANAAAQTIAYYRNHFRIVCATWPAETPLHRVTDDQIRDYIRVRRAAGVSVSTIVSKELQVLDRILRLAHRRGAIAGNPMGRVRKPKVRRERFDWIPGERVAQILALVRGWEGGRLCARDADVLAVAFYTGLRRAEMGRLRREDVDWAGSRIFVRGKTGDRYVPLNAECRAALARLAARAGGELVIGTWRMIEKLFERWRKRLEEPRLKPHVLRHSFGSALARAGVSPYTIRDLMGHQTLTQSMRYIHSFSEQSHAAVDALTLHGDPSGEAAAGP